MSELRHVAGEEALALAGAARLFGDLLLVELDGARLEALGAPEPAALLAELGVEVPAARGVAAIDELAAEYHAAFLRPDGGGAPPIASLWTEGRFEGDIARRTRELAESAALEFGAEAARGAPRDHLGSLLHLWAASVERAPWVADELAEQHLAWADAPLRRVAGGGGFYGRVAAATLSLLEELRGTRVGA